MEIDLHRWYAVIKENGDVAAVIAGTPDGLVHFDGEDALAQYQEWSERGP